MTLKSRATLLLAFHFATAISLSFSSAVAASDYSYTRNYEIQPEDRYRPYPFTEAKPEAILRWTSYINWLSTQPQPQVAKEFYFIQRQLAFQVGSKQVVELLKLFQEKRSILPIEIRWLVAAIEIQTKVYSKETFEDAKSALRHVDITESSGFLGVGGGIDGVLLYRGVHPNKGNEPEIISLYSLADLAFLHRSWHEVTVLDKNFKSDNVLDRKRIRWLQVIASMTYYFLQRDSVTLIKDFDDPKMRQFSDEPNLHDFLSTSIRVMEKFGAKFGDISFNQHGDVNYKSKGDGNDGFATVRTRVENWIAESLNYTLQNFTQLSRLHLISIEGLLKRTATDLDRELLVRLIQSDKIKVDSKIAASLLWMKQHGESDQKVYIQAVTILHDALISNATLVHGAVRVSNTTIEGTHYTTAEYSGLLKEFYSMLSTNRRLTVELAGKLLKKQSLKIPGMSELEWQHVEWSRYTSLEKSLPREALLEHLTQVAANEIKSELFDRVIAAEFIRTRIKPKNLQDLAVRVKAQAQGIKSTAYKITEDKIWAKDNAELVTVMRSLDPSDHEMHKFLSNIYAGRSFDGPIAGQTALSLLADSGRGNDEIKKEILQRLQYVTAGDSVATFTALIRLFPQAGEEIMEVVYRHRTAPEKLKPMLFALIDECVKNPALLESIKAGLASSPNRTAAKALYQNLELGPWLDIQVNRKKEAQSSTENLCKVQLNGKK